MYEEDNKEDWTYHVPNFSHTIHILTKSRLCISYLQFMCIRCISFVYLDELFGMVVWKIGCKMKHCKWKFCLSATNLAVENKLYIVIVNVNRCCTKKAHSSVFFNTTEEIVWFVYSSNQGEVSRFFVSICWLLVLAWFCGYLDKL